MNIFQHVPFFKPKRNAFNLSHDLKLTANIGDLVPILAQEVVPGDTFKINSEILLRLAPMLAPVYHRVNVYTHFFFVPNRLVWSSWEQFITGGEDGTDVPVPPYIAVKTWNSEYFKKNTLWDYMGYPVSSTDDPVAGSFSLLPLKAYQLIWSEFYRDQNLTDPANIGKDQSGNVDGAEFINLGLGLLRRRCYEKDYFTSALPWTQRGGDVFLPMGGSAPVTQVSQGAFVNETGGAPATGPAGFNNGSLVKYPGQADEGRVKLKDGAYEADLTEATSVTINDLRRATRLQTFLEKSARGGGRYIEQIMSHFGVKSRDSRLQRPEYLGGGKQPIVLSEVLQLSAATPESPQGTMTGHGISVGKSNRVSYTSTEHGYIIGIMSVVPRTGYQQGCPKQLTRFDRLEYYWPDFSHLGEQPIKNREIFNSADDWWNEQTFGYTPRYAEYKFQPNRVCGDFRDNMAYWHMGRIFHKDSKPSLSADFVEISKEDSNRPFAVTDNSHPLWVNIFHDITAVRPMPKFGVPTL